MKKTLFLHIGYPKTGTTSIQQFLTMNEQALSQVGVLYPKTGRLNNAHYVLNFSLGIGGYDGGETIASKEKLKTLLFEESNLSDCKSIIISSEYFVTASKIQDVRDFFSNFETKIIVYLRRHDYAFESGFSQSEKTTRNPAWEPDIASYTLYSILSNSIPYDYLNTLLRWRKVFGDENIIVRPFEKQQNIPDLYSDFLNAANIKDSSDFVRPGVSNISFGKETLMALRIIRKLNLPEKSEHQIINRLFSKDTTNPSEFYFSPSMRKLVLSKYAPSYKFIAKEFLKRNDGVLFCDMEIKEEHLTAPEPYNVDKVYSRVVDAITPFISKK